MKFVKLISLVTIFTIVHIFELQASTPYTVIANVGDDAATKIRLNWHTDEESGESVCHYTSVDDETWANAKSVKSQQELCVVFDSIYSKTADGKDFYEQVRFIRNILEINSLTPGTRYKYRINDDNTIRYFKTAPASNNWTAAIISDFHAYTPLPARKCVAMDMLSTLERINSVFDMVLHVGDIIAWGGSYSFWRDLYDNDAFGKYVWAGVNGNHDNMSRGYAHQTNKFFCHTNNNPQNGYQGEKGVCYHFIYGNTLFIMLNSESMTTTTGLNNAQQWVRDVIRDNSSKFIVVMEHYQWFYGETGAPSQYDRWKQLFDECGVDLAIAANNHIYVRTNAIFNGEETDGSKGTVYIQTPSSDNERGQELKTWTENQSLIKSRWSEGGKTVGALLLNATDNNLTIALYDRNGNKIDEVVVKEKDKNE